MKKEFLLVILMAFAVLISGCSFTKQEESRDPLKFKAEYEELNGVKMGSSDNTYLSLELPNDNKIKYATIEEVLETLEKGTGVIYFGFPKCPWCRNMIPVLIDAASDSSLTNILYYNAYDIRDQKSLDKDGKIQTDKEGTKEYYELIEKLSSILEPYEGLKDDSIKRLYFPTVVMVKNGKIVDYHIGTVDSQEDCNIPLTDEQKEELYQIYYTGIVKVTGEACDANTQGC